MITKDVPSGDEVFVEEANKIGNALEAKGAGEGDKDKTPPPSPEKESGSGDAMGKRESHPQGGQGESSKQNGGTDTMGQKTISDVKLPGGNDTMGQKSV